MREALKKVMALKDAAWKMYTIYCDASGYDSEKAKQARIKWATLNDVCEMLEREVRK